VHVHDDIFHFSIVNSPLRGGAPSVLRSLEIREEADDVHGRQVNKIERLRIFHAAAKHKVEFAVVHKITVS
jgi:hypothetical protein